MVRTAVLALAASGFFVLATAPAMAEEFAGRQFAQAGSEPFTEAPARPRRRPRTRIEVRPGYTEPVPPGTRRECAFRLVQEFRPSGTVLVPRERCWWVR